MRVPKVIPDNVAMHHTQNPFSFFHRRLFRLLCFLLFPPLLNLLRCDILLSNFSLRSPLIEGAARSDIVLTR